MDVFNIVRSLLVYVIIEPVGKEQVSMSAPGHQRSLVGVIVSVIVNRHVNGQSLGQVATIFRVQRIGRILGMTRHEDLASVACHHHAYTTLFALGDDAEFGHLQDIFTFDFGVTAMRHIKDIVKAPEDGQTGIAGHLGEDTEHLAWQRILGHSIMIIKSGLCRPADIHHTGYMSTRPIEYFRDFLPVVHLGLVKMFHRRAGDYHTVKLLALHFLKVAIESLHVFYGRILAGMRLYLHQVYIQLQRRVGQQTHQVCLGGYLQRHQVKDGYTQGANVLAVGTFVPQYKDVLLLEKVYCRKPVGQS